MSVWLNTARPRQNGAFGMDVYRFAVRQLQTQRDTVKDELRVFLGAYPRFREIEDYLPAQRGRAVDARNLELKEHRLAALTSLRKMRENHESMRPLYHATGTGKTVTAIMEPRPVAEECLVKYAPKEISVLCACDLLNEGWDDPQTEVLFMARPTMPKVLYTQQLGREMRLAEDM